MFLYMLGFIFELFVLFNLSVQVLLVTCAVIVAPGCPRAVGSRTLCDTKVHGCSSLLLQIVQISAHSRSLQLRTPSCGRKVQRAAPTVLITIALCLY